MNAGLAGRLVRHRGALVGLVILSALALMALAAPWLSPRCARKACRSTSAASLP